MERQITVWNGAPESDGICTKSLAELKDFVQKQSSLDDVKKFSGDVAEYIFKNQNTIACMAATDPGFAQYGCMTFDDIGVIQRYIETLLSSCQKWKPVGAAPSK